MRTLTALFFLTFTAMATAETVVLPEEGKFAGSGRWQALGQDGGTYSVETEIADGKMNSIYIIEATGEGEPQEQKVELTYRKVEDKKFDLLSGGEKVGSMVCFDVQCLMNYTIGGANISETMTFIDNHLYRTGNKTFTEGDAIFWQEALDVVEETE